MSKNYVALAPLNIFLNGLVQSCCTNLNYVQKLLSKQTYL